MNKSAAIEWESRWAPYDELTYQEVLALVRPDDIVLDIGAGDLRLARQIAQRAGHVYALERNPSLLAANAAAPTNLTIIEADARIRPFPAGITLGVLLMRHCRHFSIYRDKLAAVGCRRLITNARWKMGVELIYLDRPLRPFSSIEMGWYACRCGEAGFAPGPAEKLTPSVYNAIVQVKGCPACRD